jgi:hypothetical protein
MSCMASVTAKYSCESRLLYHRRKYHCYPLWHMASRRQFNGHGNCYSSLVTSSATDSVMGHLDQLEQPKASATVATTLPPRPKSATFSLRHGVDSNRRIHLGEKHANRKSNSCWCSSYIRGSYIRGSCIRGSYFLRLHANATSATKTLSAVHQLLCMLFPA